MQDGEQAALTQTGQSWTIEVKGVLLQHPCISAVHGLKLILMRGSSTLAVIRDGTGEVPDEVVPLGLLLST